MESRDKLRDVSWNPRLIRGLPVPLFERFREDVDDRRVLEPYRIHTLELLLKSIQREIAHLLNTRLPPKEQPATSWVPISEPETVLDYGLPAFSSMSSGSTTDIALLRETVLRKLARFEPRLIDPQLELHPDPEDPAGMLGVLRGKVRLDLTNQPIHFELKLGDHGESATILSASAEPEGA